MDKFSYTVLLKTLETNPLNTSIDTLKEALATLDAEQLYTIWYTLNHEKYDVQQAKHVVELLPIRLW